MARRARGGQGDGAAGRPCLAPGQPGTNGLCWRRQGFVLVVQLADTRALTRFN